MEDKHQKIIDLVNLCIDQKKYNQTITREDYQLIKDNQLTGLVFNGLNKELINDELYSVIKSDYYQYIRKDEIQKQLILEIRELFNNNNIDFIFLKGSFLKAIYPQSYMRAMGDIDILVKKDKMKVIHDLLEKNGFKNWSNSAAHDCFMKQHINIEIHPSLDSNIEGAYQDLFSNPWEYAIHDNDSEYLLGYEYNYFYQVYHMIKHLYRSGVGYRTFVDLMLYLKVYENRINVESFLKIYMMFPKQNFIDFTIQIINALFNYKVMKVYNFMRIVELRYIDSFVDYLFISGAHGIGETHNLFIGDMAKKHKKRKWIIFTKIDFLFKRTFLGLTQMKGIYRYLQKYPFLLPIAWIQRLFKLVSGKRSRQKLKRLQVNKSDVVKVEELFNHIGI